MEPIKRGRKNLPKGIKRELLTFKFDPSTVEALATLPKGQRTKFIESLIRDALKLKPLA